LSRLADAIRRPPSRRVPDLPEIASGTPIFRTAFISSQRKIRCGLISRPQRAGRLFNGISKFDKRGARPVMVRCSESDLEEAQFPASTGCAGQEFRSGPGASP
jgi:hypothetical protein